MNIDQPGSKPSNQREERPATLSDRAGLATGEFAPDRSCTANGASNALLENLLNLRNGGLPYLLLDLRHCSQAAERAIQSTLRDLLELKELTGVVSAPSSAEKRLLLIDRYAEKIAPTDLVTGDAIAWKISGEFRIAVVQAASSTKMMAKIGLLEVKLQEPVYKLPRDWTDSLDRAITPSRLVLPPTTGAAGSYGKLDLHGLSGEAAKERVFREVNSAQVSGRSCIMIIVGEDHGPVRKGANQALEILKDQGIVANYWVSRDNGAVIWANIIEIRR